MHSNADTVLCSRNRRDMTLDIWMIAIASKENKQDILLKKKKTYYSKRKGMEEFFYSSFLWFLIESMGSLTMQMEEPHRRPPA